MSFPTDWPGLGAGAQPPPPEAPHSPVPTGMTDAEAADFAEWRARKDAEAAAKEENEREARAEAQADADRQRRRDAEDSALCPNCKAPRNNPSRIGNAEQEYLNHCWRCGFGAGAGQTYPAVD